MAFPAFRSQASNTGEGVTSVVVTKPSGVAVGDVLYAFATGFDSSTHTITLSGWTSVLADNGTVSYYVFRRIADASDVSASNYTFTYSTTVDGATAAIIAISAPAPGLEIEDEFTDFIDSTPSNVATLAGTATPRPNNESLVITYFLAVDFNLSAILTSSARTLTPSVTLTERIDTGLRNGSSDGCSIFVATGEYQDVDDITGATFTISEELGSGSDIAVGGVVIINGVQNATATNAAFEVVPALFTPTISNTNNPTNAVLEVLPNFPTQSADGVSPSEWSNPDKPSTSWTNTPK